MQMLQMIGRDTTSSPQATAGASAARNTAGDAIDSSEKARDRSQHHLGDLGESYTPTTGSPFARNWRAAVRLLLTFVAYAMISHHSRIDHIPTVVYTCSSSAYRVEPRALNTRIDTKFEVFRSGDVGEKDSYFCKVKAARGMLQRHPGKRIVYVDEHMVVDLQAVIEDVGCTRLSFFVDPINELGKIVSTNFFCFSATQESMDMLDQWWGKKDVDFKKLGAKPGPPDQAALNELLTHRGDKSITLAVPWTDPTGIQIAHCGPSLGSARWQCKNNMSWLIVWDRCMVWLWAIVWLGLWLLPLSIACGLPLVMPGWFGDLLDVNPLTILVALGLPRILSRLMVRNNRLPGKLPTLSSKMLSGMVFLNVGHMQQLWVPNIGLFTLFPEDKLDTLCVVAYIVLFCGLVVYRKEVDRWTCVTCPTLYHWLVWSKTAADRCTRLAGTGRWLAVTPSGPNVYHLSCGSTAKCEVGVPASRVHGQPVQCSGLQPESCGTTVEEVGAVCQVRDSMPTPSFCKKLGPCWGCT